MKNLRNIGGIVIVLLVLTVGSATAATTTNENIPLDMWVWVSCANGGSGEGVYLTGTLHVTSQWTISANTVHYAAHFQPMGVSGYGQFTGDKYQATGVTSFSDTFHVDGFPYAVTYMNNFRIIGQGPGNNYLVHENFHVTINAKGDVTTQVDNFRAECK
jgi:hypothetical protein